MTKLDESQHFAFAMVLFLGRDLAEYRDMFNLDQAELRGKRILDCAAGPSSFACEMYLSGFDVTACDPMYGGSLEELLAICDQDVQKVGQRQQKAARLFHDYALSSEFKNRKSSSRRQFLADYIEGKESGRYVRASLPQLPFADQSFDLVLCANFLFLYTPLASGGMLIEDRFDFDFHKNAVLELMRVCRGEARIYPIKGPHHDEQHDYVERLFEDESMREFELMVDSVTYRDIRHAHHMLRLSRRSAE
ncbi:MAG: class I SAM-dependent methyltransferase [Candidatus Obscuribacterales bacterium]|nr:class I SAM-dependent methyltransferase [Candidatus Obscuribacterales bacterium]